MLVSWGVVYRLNFIGGLGVSELQAINLPLLTEWVDKLMRRKVDLTTQVLKDPYSPWMDSERHRLRPRGIGILAKPEGCIPPSS